MMVGLLPWETVGQIVAVIAGVSGLMMSFWTWGPKRWITVLHEAEEIALKKSITDAVADAASSTEEAIAKQLGARFDGLEVEVKRLSNDLETRHKQIEERLAAGSQKMDKFASDLGELRGEVNMLKDRS